MTTRKKLSVSEGEKENLVTSVIHNHITATALKCLAA